MSLITTEVRGRVGLITLNDPDKRNAITLAMNDEIGSALDAWEADENIGAVVLTGAGSNAEEMKAIYDGFLRIAHTPLPTVAAVNGAAVGAGMNMVLACDLVLAGREYAKFDSRFLQIGIHPGGGHTWRLRQIAGRSTTMAMVIFNQILRAERAKEVGLAWDVIDDADLVDTAVEMAAIAAGQDRELNARTKATILTLDTVTESNQAVDYEIHPQVWSMGQPPFMELVTRLQKDISSKG